MRVENHTEHFMKIPIMGQDIGGEKGHVAEVDAVTLFPGVNDVDPAKWDKVKSIELIKNLIHAGARRGGLVVGDPKKSLETLAEFPERDALDTVEDTVDKALLDAWRTVEKRAKVLAAIAEQIEKIDPKEARNAVRG